jgi:hypothetical protein
MTYTLLIHLEGTDPIVADIDKLPDTHDQVIMVNNPRQRDGRDLANLMPEVQTVIYPWNRITFIEVMPTEEEEEIIGFIRE